ncbi:MAG: hypothetical protein AMJ46_14020 [Latescibacteria bacterium DG_63]|nr:MAG: hypothetical protein AMJ46_14020 [Latescibacteria bacterium DG_63]
MEFEVLKQLFQFGGGYVLAAVFAVLFFLERRATKEQQQSKDRLYDKLFKMSEDQTKVITGVEGVLRENDRTLDNVVSTLNMLSSRRD